MSGWVGVCVCACACVRERGCVCVCVCVCAALLQEEVCTDNDIWFHTHADSEDLSLDLPPLLFLSSFSFLSRVYLLTPGDPRQIYLTRWLSLPRHIFTPNRPLGISYSQVLRVAASHELINSCLRHSAQESCVVVFFLRIFRERPQKIGKTVPAFKVG